MKRTVATDALETLGSIITDKEQRDAIHLAVDNVVAGQILIAGEDVGFLPDGTVGECSNPVGIVDPFLTEPVGKGDHFWLVVYPREITSLRHVWSHPAFKDETAEVDPVVEEIITELSEIDKSQNWINAFAASIPLDVYNLMEGAKDFIENDEYLCYGGLLDGESVPKEFWIHYQIITQEKVEESNKHSFFTCRC